jgi:hypothetical protein
MAPSNDATKAAALSVLNVARRAINGLIVGLAFAAAIVVAVYIVAYLFAYFAGPDSGFLFRYFFGSRA